MRASNMTAASVSDLPLAAPSGHHYAPNYLQKGCLPKPFCPGILLVQVALLLLAASVG